MISLAKTVDVVVPSPALEFVCDATCFKILAAVFSKTSSSSTNFATVTPSFVIIGLDPFLERITFLPFGPSVTATLSASLLTPLRIFCCKSISLE